jgi:hypothetical protein
MGVIHTGAGHGGSGRANDGSTGKHRDNRHYIHRSERGCNNRYAVRHPDDAIRYADHSISYYGNAECDRSDTFTNHHNHAEPVHDHNSKPVHHD